MYNKSYQCRNTDYWMVDTPKTYTPPIYQSPIHLGQSWSWSYGNWIYDYLCNQCLSPLKLWVRIPLSEVHVYSIQLYVIKFVS